MPTTRRRLQRVFGFLTEQQRDRRVRLVEEFAHTFAERAAKGVDAFFVGLAVVEG